MEVKIKKLVENAVIPKYAHSTDAGLDLTAVSKENKNGVYIYGTGLAIEIPEGYVGLIFPRSSNYKQDLWLTNCVGVIDPDYRGELLISLQNDSYETQIIKPYERIAQFALLPKYNL